MVQKCFENVRRKKSRYLSLNVGSKIKSKKLSER